MKLIKVISSKSLSSFRNDQSILQVNTKIIEAVKEEKDKVLFIITIGNKVNAYYITKRNKLLKRAKRLTKIVEKYKGLFEAYIYDPQIDEFIAFPVSWFFEDENLADYDEFDKVEIENGLKEP